MIWLIIGLLAGAGIAVVVGLLWFLSYLKSVFSNMDG